MSLQLAAQHLASRGRGPDTQLIHMAPQEVAGLHALAKAHGGELTTNPDTGLPEAGFLSSLLPMVIGAALAPFTGGMSAALITGAGYTAATGSLKKGLMAGLGAFGGAGLAGGLSAAGTAAAGAGEGLAGAAGATAGAGTGLSALDAGMGAFPSTGTIGAEALGAGAGQGVQVGAPILDAANMSQTGTNFFGGSSATPMVSPINAAELVPTTTPAPPPQPQSDFLSGMDRAAIENKAVAGFNPANTGSLENMQRGLSGLMDNQASRDAFMTKMGGGSGLLKSGMMAAAPGIMEMLTPKQRAEAEIEKRKAFEYSYSPNYNPTPDVGYTGAQTGERMHLDHRFTRTAAGGGLMDIQPIEAMSQQNQSQMRPAYAQGGVSDMAVNPYTGAENFAEGGDTAPPPPKAVRPVEQDPYYTMSGQSADMYKYLMGQGTRPAAPAPAAPVAAAEPAPESRQSGIGSRAFGAPGRRLSAATTSGISNASNTTMRPYDFDPVTGEMTAQPVIQGTTAAPDEGNYYIQLAHGGIASLAQGGQSHLGDYSDGGRLLRGPGDGVSDSIPASIGDKRPARLADGEFVVPARIVSELGNGSTEAGARKLYAMMDRVQKARKKSIGKNRVAVNSRAEKLLPA